MVAQPKAEHSLQMALSEFEAFIALPENSDKRFEYIMEEAIEVPSNPYVSNIAAQIIFWFGLYLMNNDIAHITGEGGGYRVGGWLFAPDLAFISYVRQPELARRGYNPNPPELAVEVISDPDSRQEQNTLRIKLSAYLAAGTAVWIVDAEARTLEVHRPGYEPITLDETGTVNGGDILPGFTLAVKDIFPKSKPDEHHG